METHPHRCAPAYRQRTLDNIIHHLLETLMDELKYELLAEVYGKMEAELIKSYLEAYGIDVELFQESVGQNIYPTTIDTLGNVQIFVSKDKIKDALELLEKIQK
jgi:hypothetical protein